MNNYLAKKIFKAGANRRNPKLFLKAEELRSSDFYSLDQYKSIQQEKLKSLFDFASKNSNFYKHILPVSTSNLDSFSILSGLPVIEKQEFLSKHKQLQCYSQFDKLFLAETSGSTGQPFKFKKNINWDTMNRATIIRSYWWYAVEAWEKNGYFWGYSFSDSEILKTKVLDILQNRFRSFNFNKQDLKRFLDKLKSASYLHGYSSVIYEVAQIALELGYTPKDFPQLKLVKGTSEKIYDYYHDPVREAFGHKIVSEYGAAETGIIAFECPHGKMHVNEEGVIIEEKNGEAIVTNLNAYSIPVIRYKLGDSIILNDKEQCSCGRKSRIIDEVIGRVGKKILGKIDKYPSLTLYYIFKNISLSKGVDIQYQGFQSKKGVLELKITKSLSKEERSWITEQKRKYFKNDLDLVLLENQQIHDKKGKLKDFITELE